ncbi:MAG: hypothetical protein HFI62_07745 [Lachnospiraceae bacterium]|nr:hypothetical protein [Lachnospiraceae bacterium]
MSYCVNCGVELEASLKACPLCHTPVINPKQIGQPVPPSPYPVNKGQVEVVKRKDLGILLSVVLIATSGTCLLLNLLAFNNSLWSLLVIGICICLFVFTFPAVYYSKTPVYISLLADGVAVAVYLYMIGFLTPSHRWFWQLGLPIVTLITAMMEIFTFLARKFPFTVLSGALCLFIEIPVFCVALELFIRHMLLKPMYITWSAVVLTVCTIIDFALFTILVKKRLRNEVRRRLHF